MKVNIPQITIKAQKMPVCLSDGEQKDLRRLVNAALRAEIPLISQQRLINLKYRLSLK